MSFWAACAFINAVITGALGIIVYFRNKTNERNLSYVLFCLSLCIWSLCYFVWQISTNATLALFWSRALMSAATFIPICYLHHIYSLLGYVDLKRKVLFWAYSFGIASALFLFHPLFIGSVSPKMVFSFWPNAGPFFLPFLIVWFFFVFLG